MLLYTIVPQKYQSQHISIDNNTLHVYENKSTYINFGQDKTKSIELSLNVPKWANTLLPYC